MSRLDDKAEHVKANLFKWKKVLKERKLISQKARKGSIMITSPDSIISPLVTTANLSRSSAELLLELVAEVDKLKEEIEKLKRT